MSYFVWSQSFNILVLFWLFYLGNSVYSVFPYSPFISEPLSNEPAFPKPAAFCYEEQFACWKACLKFHDAKWPFQILSETEGDEW